MILGTMALASPAVTINQIPEQILLINMNFYRPAVLTGKAANHSAYMRAIIRLGQRSRRIMKRIEFLIPKTIF